MLRKRNEKRYCNKKEKHQQLDFHQFGSTENIDPHNEKKQIWSKAWSLLQENNMVHTDRYETNKQKT